MNIWPLVLFIVADAFVVYFIVGGLIGRAWGESMANIQLCEMNKPLTIPHWYLEIKNALGT